MSNTMSVVTGKKFKAFLNNEKIDIHYCRFVAMANDIYDASFYSKDNKHPAQTLYNRALTNYSKIKNKPVYFMSYPYDGVDWVGAVIHKVPDDFEGTFDEYDLDNFEVVGTLLKDRNKRVVEQDLVVIEKIRRNKEFNEIANGTLTIFFSENKNDLKSPAKYIEHLENKDKESEQYITRGHGL
jgi:hypothetical protein